MQSKLRKVTFALPLLLLLLLLLLFVYRFISAIVVCWRATLIVA